MCLTVLANNCASDIASESRMGVNVSGMTESVARLHSFTGCKCSFILTGTSAKVWMSRARAVRAVTVAVPQTARIVPHMIARPGVRSGSRRKPAMVACCCWARATRAFSAIMPAVMVVGSTGVDSVEIAPLMSKMDIADASAACGAAHLLELSATGTFPNVGRPINDDEGADDADAEEP